MDIPYRHSVLHFDMSGGKGLAPEELLRWAETEVAPTARLAIEGKGEYQAGEHCRFCKARFTCRKRSEYFMALARRIWPVIPGWD